MTVKAIYEYGVFRPKEPVSLPELPEVAPLDDDDPTGWKAADRFVGFIEDAPEGEPIAAEHDKYLYR